MSEWRLFSDPVAHVSTMEFHHDRERAPHLEQDVHRPRLLKAHELVSEAIEVDQRWRVRSTGGVSHYQTTVVDLGCGDGGLLSLLKNRADVKASGYDFQPSNAAGWAERGVTATQLDFVAHLEEILEETRPAVVVLTEVLEHLTDPHGVVNRIGRYGPALICSSPWTETYDSHDACHAWAWDQDGYATLVRDAGYVLREHATVGMFQLIRAAM